MKLDEAQAARVQEWINQGLSVAEVQTRLGSELGITVTYMEARFLLDDLKLRPKDAPAPARPATPVLPEAPASAPGRPSPVPSAGPQGRPLSLSPEPVGAGVPGGGVSVSLDEIARPGALVSGKVTFSDGQGAEWQIDQYGRPSVMPRTPGYKPTQADIIEFQGQLESILARFGY